MTKKRAFKNLVRERMAKTGERYSTARAHVLAAASPEAPAARDQTGGQTGETGALRNALARAGEPGSEALMLGLCGGIGFLYAVFEYQGHPPMLTLVGRARQMPDAFLAEGVARAGRAADVRETTSARKARADLDETLGAGRSALCVVDAAALGHHGMPAEMAGMGPHVVGVLRAEGDDVWLDDRGAEPLRVSAAELAAARAGYRRGKHRLVSFDPEAPTEPLEARVRDALAAAARLYAESPAKSFASNIGVAGLEKWARLLVDEKDKKGWPRVFADGARACLGLRRVYDCVQHDYTAPDASRPMFATFLDEAAQITGNAALSSVADSWREAGARWAGLSERLVGSSEPSVARACALSDRRAALLDEGGDASEMIELWKERASVVDGCTLDAGGARAMYAELAPLVSELAAIEAAAHRDLVAAIA